MVAALPRMMSFMRARVMATFMRRKSRRNPICPSAFSRTREMMMTSRSWPWNPSTVLTLMRWRKGLNDVRCLFCRRHSRICAL